MNQRDSIEDQIEFKDSHPKMLGIVTGDLNIGKGEVVVDDPSSPTSLQIAGDDQSNLPGNEQSCPQEEEKSEDDRGHSLSSQSLIHGSELLNPDIQEDILNPPDIDFNREIDNLLSE